MADRKALEQTVVVELILGIAEALRAEFGNSIDAHPGGKGNEAGVVKRAFRAATRRILGTILPRGEDVETTLTWALRQSALRRLVEVGVDGDLAATLLDSEPRLGDAWLVNVALAPASVLVDLIDDGIVRDQNNE